jgi:hypothetical protein
VPTKRKQKELYIFLLYSSNNTIQVNNIFFLDFFFGNKNETSINYRRVTRFQQTNNVRMIASLTERNRLKIPRIFSSLSFPQLKSSSLGATTSILLMFRPSQHIISNFMILDAVSPILYFQFFMSFLMSFSHLFFVLPSGLLNNGFHLCTSFYHSVF